MSVRVRFAPSPTGYLHIGGARTALFNWLYARHTGGKFILRIEDTDAARNTQPAVDVILQGLRWLGLDWDEGPETADPTGASRGRFGPYFQSQRKEIYQARVRELIEKGAAYESEGAVKFRMRSEPVIIPDLVVGDVRRELTDREEVDPDFVLVRSDGQPVFHLVNVIDDLEMGITHVIRGEDHLANTAKHIALFEAFGVRTPHYAHIPLILNKDGTKMSKRDQGASLTSYMEEGFAPEALVNYLYLLGWSPKDNREVMPLSDVIEIFDLPQILRHNSKFDLNKLHWMQIEYFKQMPLDRFVGLAVENLRKLGVSTDGFERSYIDAALATCKEKIKSTADLMVFAAFYFRTEVNFEKTVVFTDQDKSNLSRLKEAFKSLEIFDLKTIEAALKNLAGELKVKAGILVHPLRLACTGNSVGPSLYHLMEVLGKDQVLKRLDRAMGWNP